VKTKLNDGTALIKQITIKKSFNYFKIRFSYITSIILKRAVIWGVPYSISIEPTSICNLNCPECPTGNKTLNRQSGNMNLQTFRNIIDSLYKYLLFTNLYFQGEPFLNPSIFEFINYASGKKIYTGTSTNGHFLNMENAEKTIKSGLNRIIISLDGIDQETYASYRIGGDHNTVIEGIKNLVEAKKAMKSDHPYIILQFLVLKTNEHQIPEMKKLARQLEVDELQFKTAQFYNFSNGINLIPDNNKYSRYKKSNDGNWVLKKTIKNRCYKMWHSAVITWNGDVVPCCFDKNADHKFGNIMETNIKDIWNNNDYKQFKTMILKNRKSINICINCTE
jgi:radical SAM protein with 4Fe4S-binding SPASM domain